MDGHFKPCNLPEDAHNSDQNSVLWRISTRRTADQNRCSHECDSFRIALEYYLFLAYPPRMIKATLLLLGLNLRDSIST